MNPVFHKRYRLFKKSGNRLISVKILLNARALIQNSSFRIEVDGRLLEATLNGNIKEFIF